jgi:hypothetical protein
VNREAGLTETIDLVNHERRKHVAARIIQHPVIDREQQVVDRLVGSRQSCRTIYGLPYC